jgi:hypothetical protein
VLRTDESGDVRARATHTLREFKDDETVYASLLEAARDRDEAVCIAAIEELSALCGPEVKDIIAAAARHPSARVRSVAEEAIERQRRNGCI